MRNFLVVWSLIIITTCSVLYSFPIKTNAQSEQVFVEGWYCDDTRNAVMHEVFGLDPNAPPVTSIWLDCGVSEVCAPLQVVSSVDSRDADCVGRTSNTPPARGPGTGTFARPPQVNPGGSITIGVTSDRDFGNACFNQITAASLQVTGRLRDCQVPLAQCGCVTKHVRSCDANNVCNCNTQVSCGPGDWPANTVDNCGEATGVNPYDNRQCFTNITCNAEGAIGNFDAPIITPTPQCLNHIAYSIVQPQGGTQTPDGTCLTGTHPNTAPNSANVDKGRITEDSISDDLTNANKLSMNYPDSVATDLERIASADAAVLDPTTRAPVAGVAQSPFCSARIGIFSGLVQAVITVLGIICPEPTLFLGNSLSPIATISQEEADLGRPYTITYRSQPQDCSISDVRGANGQQSDGDAKMRQYSASMGGNNGVYGRLTPDFPNSQLRIDPLKSVYSNGITYDGSLILPEANGRCIEYSQDNVPVDNGISFCHDGKTAGGNLAPTQEPPP